MPTHDKWFIGTLIAIAAFGLLMMTSASIAISDQLLHQPFYFLYKQLIFMTLGVAVGVGILQIDLSAWEKWGGYLLLLTLLLLALVLMPGIGHRANGSARWIGYGPLTFQISELAKLMMVVYMAGYLVRRQEEVRTQLSGFVKPICILGVVSVLLLKEPDFGATVVIAVTLLGMMFLAGMQLRHFLVLLGMMLSALGLLAVSAPYRMARLTGFINPWAHPLDTGYQLTQSLIAFGRGGWFGVGLGNSVQKMFYLPEAHTDFLFAVIAEEWGLMGMILVLGLFLFLVIRIFIIARKAQLSSRHFGALLAYGCGLWIAIQFIVSIGVNSGVLPTKGLTLPLMSYGGSSVLINCMMIALLLRVDYENRVGAL